MARYEILERLGSGGAGTVHRARDLVLEREVALKILTRTDDRDRDRALEEARAASALAHPNVIVVHDVGVLEDGEYARCAYVAMELVRGRTLRELAEDVGVERRIQYLEDVARALGAAHARGVFHRDVKPDNVMVTDDERVKVLDFGIARAMVPSTATTTDADIASVLETRGRAGTPAYMAPERMLGQASDARSDQFSWGVMAYELLVGERPWGAELDAVQTVAAVLHRAVRVPPTVPKRIARVVERALAKVPDDRFRSMDDLITALHEKNSGRTWLALGAMFAFGSAAVAWAAWPEEAPMTPAPTSAPTVAVIDPSVAPVATTAAPSVTMSAPPSTVRRIVDSGPAIVAISDAGPPGDATVIPAPSGSHDLYRRH